jgi:copper oxidase (laccase) domain-containing protein
VRQKHDDIVAAAAAADAAAGARCSYRCLETDVVLTDNANVVVAAVVAIVVGDALVKLPCP